MFRVHWFLLKLFASFILKTKKPEIIAVTGSVAKSTTKEAIYQVLRDKFGQKVGKSYGNLNTETGVPLSILGFKSSPQIWMWPFVLFWALIKISNFQFPIFNYPKILVLEFAANKPGDLVYLTSFVKPKISVITKVGPAHLEFFKTVERVAEEKSQLIKVLKRDDFAILNQSDPKVAKMANETKAKVKFFEEDDLAKKAAEIVGEIYQIKKEKIKKALEKLPKLKHRMEIKKGIRGSYILDDSYNANPLSMEYALEKLKAQSSKLKTKRRIAVLGDMAELGDYTEKGHQEVGQEAREIVDLLIGVGKYSKLMNPDLWFQSKEDAIKFLKKNIKKYDIILIKASRAMKFEEIVEALRASPHQ